MPIEDIEVGDYVWAENPETGEIELKEVLNTFEKQVDTIVTITIDGEKIQTTEAHLFYVEGTGWI
ncbi:MAG: polymorphic toxin-type HINT domain-containing protein, partial [Intestinibacter bartlettii]|uniref:polymorphic toxin-type HINT domain-containing protein n=1 Tax=Intestinibacter bartlettii TaxID=261299 RepID=UPI0029033526